MPLGGGLSSSAALEVAVATMLEQLTGMRLDPVDKALLCQAAEHRFAGMPCGIMDQFSSVFGRPGELMLLDCRSREIRPVPFPADQATLVIVDSRIKHSLAVSEYAQRRSQCAAALEKLGANSWRDVTWDRLERERGRLGDVEWRRARHVVGEIERTVAAAEAFRSAKWGEVGELMYSSHASLRDDYEVSCREVDVLVEAARELGPAAGVFGSRITGGGFGGCTVSLVRAEAAPEVMRELVQRYEAATGLVATSFASRPARGAHLLQP